MTRSNGHEPADPLDELDDVISDLEGTEWADEEITETNITVERGATVVVDQTGRHKAMALQPLGNDEITKTDHGLPPKSDPPAKVSLLAVAPTVVITFVKRAPAWGLVIVAIVGIAAYVALHWGK